jgi:predicted DNA-binding transcriptional regulator AlpA
MTTLDYSDDDVLSFAQWLKLAGIGKTSGLRMRAAGQAPRFWQISPNRIATTVREHRAWLASREEAKCQLNEMRSPTKRRRSSPRPATVAPHA